MYYLIILISVVIFGGCFSLNDKYRQLRGSGIASSMENNFIGAIAGLIVLFIIEGFGFEATGFTLAVSFAAALCGVLLGFVTFKALDSINLSIYSLFSMLGGMALPFFQGIVFYGEKITLAKILCFVLVCVALAVTVSNDKKKGKKIYYFAVFVLNGLFGVMSKIFASSSLKKTSAGWYSIWVAFFTAVLSVLVWLLSPDRKGAPKISTKAIAVSTSNGILNRVANFLLVIALANVDASVQYPLVTGGVIIVSTVICFFGNKKPSKTELISVALSFIAMLLLFAIPI